MFTAHQISVLGSLVNNALDQDHDMFDYPEHLSDLADTDTDELIAILGQLQIPAGADYVQAARDLCENICDSLPQTDQIRTSDDADEVSQVFVSHRAALQDARRRSQAQLAVLLRLPYGTDLDLSSEAAAFSEADRLHGPKYSDGSPVRRDREPAPNVDQFLQEWITDGSPSDQLQEDSLRVWIAHVAALSQAYPRRTLADCMLQANICLNG